MGGFPARHVDKSSKGIGISHWNPLNNNFWTWLSLKAILSHDTPMNHHQQQTFSSNGLLTPVSHGFCEAELLPWASARREKGRELTVEIGRIPQLSAKMGGSYAKISRDDGWLMVGWWLCGYAFANGSAGHWMLVVSGAFWSRDDELRHFGAKEPSNPQNR